MKLYSTVTGISCFIRDVHRNASIAHDVLIDRFISVVVHVKAVGSFQKCCTLIHDHCGVVRNACHPFTCNQQPKHIKADVSLSVETSAFLYNRI